MKKLLFVILSLFAFVAYADNTITSKEYVDGQVSNLQTQIPAKNANTVVMNTGTAGTVGEKAIYDTTAAYGAQSDALVTAAAFNTAVQNALESEFVCVEWQGSVHDNAHCLLYEVRGATQMQALPAGYTQLEYIESTGTQWIDTGMQASNNIGVSVRYAFTNFYEYNDVFGCFEPHVYIGINSNTSAMVASFRDANQVGDNGMTGVPIEQTQLDYPYTVNMNFYNSGIVDIVNLMQTSIPEHQFVSQQRMSLFGVNSYYLGSVKIYYAKITNGNSLVRDFIPARRDSDGELGMYDLVSSTFFTNSGTGEFIAGPVVYF